MNHHISEFQPSVRRLAEVVKTRLPNAYDPTQLHLEKGEIIEVLEQNVDGMYIFY